MAAFAKTTFSAATYSAFRPTYPAIIYSRVLAYHASGGNTISSSSTVVDLGCGSGQATAVWAKHFNNVIAVDPSAGMLEQARNYIAPGDRSRVHFIQSGAEEIPAIPDASVDLVTAAEACHWFEYPRVWKEVSRILKPSGTIAFWGYSDFRIHGHPSTIPVIEEYINGFDTFSLGPWWQQPGRSRIRHYLTQIPPAPVEQFEDFEHVKWTGRYVPEFEGAEDVIMKQELSWLGLESYLRTWSALSTYLERHPEVAAQKGRGAEGDPVDRLVAKLQSLVAQDGEEKETVTIDSPVAMLLYRRT